MSALAASTWPRMFDPRAARLVGDRQPRAQMPLPSSFAIAAAYFCSAALPFAGSFSSQAFSSKSFPPKYESAILMWHWITDAMALLKALARPSPHLSVETFPEGVSLVCGMQPVSSAAHELVPPVLQSKRFPGPGGVAKALLVRRVSRLPRASPTR